MSSPRHKFLAAQILQSGHKVDSPRTPQPSATENKYNNIIPTTTKYSGIKSKEYTPEKIKELLEHYNEVPLSGWNDIPIGSHVRYLKKDGDFKPGGFIRAKKSGIFILENLPFSSKAINPNYIHWTMHFDNTAKVFLKEKNNSVANVQPIINHETHNVIPLTESTPYNPDAQVENGFMQKQLDEMTKKISDLEVQYKKLQNDMAEITIFSRKIGKYIQSKGVDLS